MTVLELIDYLKEFPADAPVIIDSYEGGYCDPVLPRPFDAVLNYREDGYEGTHESVEGVCLYEDKLKSTACVFIGRNSERNEKMPDHFEHFKLLRWSGHGHYYVTSNNRDCGGTKFNTEQEAIDWCRRINPKATIHAATVIPSLGDGDGD